MAYAQAGMIEEETRDLRDYIDAFQRRRTSILITALTIFALGVAAAVLWPPTYKSTATILIEEQEIPSTLVQSTVTSYATQRIETISQRVMTRANLLEVIEKYRLYEDERKRETTEEIIERMREDIGLNMLSADVIDPRSGRPMPATIAFTLAFSSEDPSRAQKVTSELTSLYLSENLKTRTAKADETFEFLSDESSRLNTRIAELEADLATFKEAHAHSLPELKELTTTLMDRTDREVSDANNELRTLDPSGMMLQ
jgi:succinoglycan biosynthesis transport protein ExoP